MLIGYGQNTFKDQIVNLIFILVNTDIKQMMNIAKKYGKKVLSTQFKLCMLLIQFFPKSHQTEEILISSF